MAHGAAPSIPETTADRLTQVALAMFGSQGYAATSMEQIRREAGVSNGSLYHAYPTKAALAARLYADGMRQCQDGIVGAIHAAADAEAAIRDTVTFQAHWVDHHAELARLVYADWPDEVVLAAAESLDRPSRRYVQAVDRWLRAEIANGTVVDGPFTVLHALWLGPTQEFCRHWLRGRGRFRPTQAAPALGDGAWRALAARRRR